MFEPTDKIVVQFTAAEWNEMIAAANGTSAQAVIEGLMQMLRQMAVVRPLIAGIAEQAAAQQRARSEPQNGAMTKEEQEAAGRITKDVMQRLHAVDGSGEPGAA